MSIEDFVNTVFCGDGIGFVSSLPDDAKVVILTDPPYGISHPTDYESRGRGALAKCSDYPPVFGDDKPFDPTPFIRFPCCLFGGNYFAHRLPPSSGWIVWDKQRPANIDQSTCELAWTNFVKGVRVFRYLWHGCMRAGKDQIVHPTQKPVDLFKWIIGLKWFPQDAIIVDPFAGSGSALVAAKAMGKKFIGVEMSGDYVDIINKRINSVGCQFDLFGESL